MHRSPRTLLFVIPMMTGSISAYEQFPSSGLITTIAEKMAEQYIAARIASILPFSRLWFSVALFFAFTDPSLISGQTRGPSAGEVTVQLVQGLDSGTNPSGISQGKVTKTTNPAIPVGSTAVLGIGPDPANGGYTVKLLQLGIGGKMVVASSSNVVTAPDFINKMKERTRAKGQPQDAASGLRVFLPELMIVRLTLTTPITDNMVERSQPAQAQPAAPKEWVVDRIPEIGSSGQDVIQTSAILEGQSTVQGKTSGAFLVMHCGFPSRDYPSLLPLEVVLGGTDGMFDVPGMPGTFVDISDFTSSQLGPSSIQVNANAENRSNGARVRFFYDAPDMEQIVNAAGQTLKLSIKSSSSPTPTATAAFTLPSNNIAVKQLMSSCLQKSATAAQAVKAKTVASCPAPKEGSVLDAVDVIADGGKAVKSIMNELDNGGTWSIPKPVKGRPAKKITLTCSYGAAVATQGLQNSDKVSVPLPLTARMCEFTVHQNVPSNEAICLSVQSREQATVGSAMGSADSASAGNAQDSSRQQEAGAKAVLSGRSSGPVNRLNVRGITVRMGREQILAAAKAAGMVVLDNSVQQLRLVDPGVVAQTGPRSGLILTINLKDDTAVTVNIGEQGAMRGEVFDDLSKKWGEPSVRPAGYDNEMGARVGKATWGNKSDVYADYNPSIYSMGGQTITIYDAVALASHIPARKGVPM